MSDEKKEEPLVLTPVPALCLLLPESESDDELHPKSAYELAKKISALVYVIGIGYSADTYDLISEIEKYSLSEFVSPYEWERLKDPSLLTEQDRINFKWLAECVYAFSWCLSLLDLEPLKQCPNNLADSIGASLVNENDTIDSLIKRADTFLHKSKAAGRNCLPIG